MASPNRVGQLLALVSLFQVAFGYCPAFLANQTACICYQYTDGAVIKCTGPEGPVVVEQLKSVPTEIRELSIQDANIVEVGPRAFRNMNIKKLVLDNNRIRAIHPDAFGGLETTMEHLSIAYNKLPEIPTNSLLGMRALTILDLRCNKIDDIYGTVFRNVTNLIELNLACNQICKIEGPAFYGVRNTLQSLILDHNCLDEIPSEALRNMDRLLGLHMQYNDIQAVNRHQLMNMSSLVMLKLTGNNISSFDPHAIMNVPGLRYLYLDQNSMTSISSETFQELKNLEIADLSFNELSEIPTEVFKGMERLMQLNLEGNSIKDISPGAFAKLPLLLLLLGKNCLNSVNQNMFQGIPFLRQLSLAGNNIRLVQPLSFSHLANLHLLDLSGNKMLVVQPGALNASPHVTVLLQENPLVCSQDGYHIVQGGQAIHLVNEPNNVCKTDYARDSTDTCPNVTERPSPPECCSEYKNPPKPVQTTPLPETAAPTAGPIQLTKNIQDAKAVTELAVDGPTRELPVQQTVKEVSNSVSPQAISTSTEYPLRSFNLERFLRLSRRPKEPLTSRSKSESATIINPPPVAAPLAAPPKGDRVPSVRATTTTPERQPPAPAQAALQIKPIAQARARPQIPLGVGVVPAVPQVDPKDPFSTHRGPFLPGSGLLAGDLLPPTAPGQKPHPHEGKLVSATELAVPSAPFVARQGSVPRRVPSVPTNLAHQRPSFQAPATRAGPPSITSQTISVQNGQKRLPQPPPRVWPRRFAAVPQAPSPPAPPSPSRPPGWNAQSEQRFATRVPSRDAPVDDPATPTLVDPASPTPVDPATQTPPGGATSPPVGPPKTTADQSGDDDGPQPPASAPAPPSNQLPNELLAQLPPWIVTEPTNDEDTVNFNSDTQIRRLDGANIPPVI